MKARWINNVRATFVFLFVGVAPALAAPELGRRWVYLPLNFQVAANVDVAEKIMRRAAAAGYNGIVLADFKLNVLDRVPDFYFRNFARVQSIAKGLHLELIPSVAPMGYSDGIHAHDPNLAEGLPARDVPLKVTGRMASVASDLGNALPGGGFEQAKKGQDFAGWDFQDFPGQATFFDTKVYHGGWASLRIEDGEGLRGQHGNRRVSKQVRVHPWRQYHGSVWIKSEKFTGANEVRLFALGSDGRTLSFSHLGVKPDQEWHQHHVIFNSLANETVRLYLGCWGARGGKLWLDDAALEETAFVNLLRRPGCPLTITGADGSVYEEGKDFAELRDPKMGTVPFAGEFEVYHPPPALTLLPGSRIKDGATLRAAFYHAVTIYENQVPCCLAAPGVFAAVEDQIRRVQRLCAPKTWFLQHDEIRVANWCAACNRPGRSAGQLLAENVRHCVELIRAVNPGARIIVWSDMFDPFHNATNDFYLVNGDLAGSWEGLPRDVMLCNWNSAKPAESLAFFAARGHRQVLAGYYDQDVRRIRDWLGAATKATGDPARTPGCVDGVMYTTWRNQYRDLEAFAEYAWGKRR